MSSYKPITTAVSSLTIFPEAQHFVSKKHYSNYFDSNQPPVVRVKAGDLIHVETNDCFNGRIRPPIPPKNQSNNQHHCKEEEEEEDDDDPSTIVDSLTREELNPVTGPIYIEDCQPGDWLVVKLIDIIPRGIGVACCGPHSGQLCHWMGKKTTTKFFDLSNDGTIVTMREEQEEDDSILVGNNNNNNSNDDNDNRQERNGNREKQQQQTQQQQQQQQRRRRGHNRLAPISFPISPMLGVIGVAPEGEDGKIITMPAGTHGGNLDNKCNGIGSTIYLPVYHPGGLLSIGDMHASQGDGEISGTGIEIGGDVLLQCHILKESDLYDDDDDEHDAHYHHRLKFPITETSTHWITHGVLVQDIPQTTNIACEEAAKILIGQWGYTAEEAFIFLSVKGDLGLCQSCHPDQGTQIAKMMVPKLDSCPRPFRKFC